MADASGAINAAVEAATKAIYDDKRTWDEFAEDVRRNGKPRTIRKLVAQIAIEAAAPVLLAAERERIAARIEAELVCCDLYERIDACGPDQKAVGDLIRDSREKYEYHAICHWGGYAAAIARGSVAGKPAGGSS